MRLSILIPTYNELKNIEILLPMIFEVTSSIDDDIRVFIIDDNSPDGTGDLVKALAKNLVRSNFMIELISRIKKEGLGKAYLDAFQQQLSHKFSPEYVLQMDADLSHNPKYIVDFVHAIHSGADLVVGSRYIAGGSTPNWSWYRKILSVGGNLYTRFLLSKSISDYTGGFNVYSTELLKKMNIKSINHEGYGFLISFKYEAIQHSIKIVEIPIQFLDREYGESKMPITTIFRNFSLVLSMKMKQLLK